MADKITLSLVQMNSGPDRDANIARAAAHIDRAVESERPDLVVIPEFFNHPYVFNERDHEHLKRAEPATGPSITAMRAKAAEHRIHLVATLYEEEAAGLYYDTAFVIDPAGRDRRQVPQGDAGPLSQPRAHVLPLRFALLGLPGRLVEDRHHHLLRHVLSPSMRAARR